MTRTDVLTTAWGAPFWLAMMYLWLTSVHSLERARRPEYRSGVEPFSLWNDDCLTTEGQALRKRAVRGWFWFMLLGAVCVGGGFVLDRTVGVH